MLYLGGVCIQVARQETVGILRAAQWGLHAFGYRTGRCQRPMLTLLPSCHTTTTCPTDSPPSAGHLRPVGTCKPRSLSMSRSAHPVCICSLHAHADQGRTRYRCCSVADLGFPAACLFGNCLAACICKRQCPKIRVQGSPNDTIAADQSKKGRGVWGCDPTGFIIGVARSVRHAESVGKDIKRLTVRLNGKHVQSAANTVRLCTDTWTGAVLPTSLLCTALSLITIPLIITARFRLMVRQDAQTMRSMPSVTCLMLGL